MSASTLPDLIAAQNDAFRKGLPHHPALHGERVHTRGIEALGLETVPDIWSSVRKHDVFTEDNDPHGEHDFGAIDHPVAGKVFWKIDYYNLDFSMGSEDPSDPDQTRRVLTVMLAQEW